MPVGKPKEKKICLMCGKEFQPTVSHHKYCGSEKKKTGCSYLKAKLRWKQYKWENRERNRERKRELDMKYVFNKRFGGLRELVIKRDMERCVLCGITRKEHKKRYGRDITVDHVDGNGRGSLNPNNKMGNLRTLCLVCNLAESKNRLAGSKIKNRL